MARKKRKRRLKRYKQKEFDVVYRAIFEDVLHPAPKVRFPKKTTMRLPPRRRR